MIDLKEFSDLQRATAAEIADLPKDQQPRNLLQWALARITFYGPSKDPCAQCIREFLEHGYLFDEDFTPEAFRAA